jgi:Flp pilus assembly protein TadB
MGILFITIPVLYLISAAGIFYIFFIRKKCRKRKEKNFNIRIIVLKRTAVFLNRAAERLGSIFFCHKRKEKLNTRTGLLKILENEKDIRITPPAFLGYKLFIASLLAAAGIFLASSSPYRILFAAIGMGAGYFIPDILVYGYSKRITEDIEKELPYVIDLLRISSLSGHNIYNSFKIVSRKYNGKISGSLKDFIRLIDLGTGKDYAYRSLMFAGRSEQFREFISILCEADRYGSSIEDILSRRAVQINHYNWDNAERKAKKKGLFTLIPLTCLILPAFVLLVGGPLIYSMAKGLLF